MRAPQSRTKGRREWGDTVTTEEYALLCRGLRYQFGETVAVDGVDLAVARGRDLRSARPQRSRQDHHDPGDHRAAAGTARAIAVFGLDVARRKMAVRRLVGYVPQQLSADGSLTGRENVALFARLFDVPRRSRTERVDEAIEAMGLGDAADRLASTYSGGMIRRLELAQALVSSPRLLILDEPTIGLDPVARAGVWERISAVRGSTGMTVLVTTHYMDEAEQPCDRVALMHRGRVRAVGTPAELIAGLGPAPRSTTCSARYSGADLLEDDQSGGFRDVRQLAVPLDASAEPGFGTAVWRMLSRVGALCLVELQKLRHDRTELITRRSSRRCGCWCSAQTFTRLRAIPTGDVPYLDFLAPGILAQSTLFISIFYGIQIIWDRDAGVLAKLMVTPDTAGRSGHRQGVRGRGTGDGPGGGGARPSRAARRDLTTNPLRLLAASPWAARRRVLRLPVHRHRRAGAGPRPDDGHRAGDHDAALLRLQRALPGDLMPGWLQAINHVNPLSYQVEALRGLLIHTPARYVLDVVVLIVAAAVAIGVAAGLLARLAR